MKNPGRTPHCLRGRKCQERQHLFFIATVDSSSKEWCNGIDHKITDLSTLYLMPHMSHEDRGSTVVKVLYYKSEGRLLDPS